MKLSRPSRYLLQDSVNLPNLAAMFWSHADEERSHAIQFMQYLRMRGAENNNFFGDTPIQPKEGRFYWSSVDEVCLRKSGKCFDTLFNFEYEFKTSWRFFDDKLVLML